MSTSATNWPDLFGRNYSLSVDMQNGGSVSLSSADLEPGALRLTFDVSMHVTLPLWWGEISIYNPDFNTEKSLTQLQQGDTIVLQAGYVRGSHQLATIFQGQLFQPFFHRENVVDRKVTLQCYAGNLKNFVNTNYAQLQTQRQIVLQAIRAATTELTPGVLDASLDQVQLPRGGVIFGDCNKTFSQAARDQGLLAWVDPTGTVNVADWLNSNNALVPNHNTYAPPIPPGSGQKAKSGYDYCIVDSPEQTLEGVGLTVLLDPTLKIKYPPDVIQIDMSSTSINLLPQNGLLGNGPGFIPPPDPSGNYVVAGIRHRGDTRGQPWYSDITGVTKNGLLLAVAPKL